MKVALLSLLVCLQSLAGVTAQRTQVRAQNRFKRNSPFSYLDKQFLQNEREFLDNYHNYRSRNLAGNSAPLMVSNAASNESPADIQASVQAILHQNNITGSVVIITNFEAVPSQATVSKFEIDPSPFHHPYYYNSEQAAKSQVDSKAAAEQLMSTQSPYANLIFPPEPITFRDIPTIMVIANSVMTIYNYFQAFIPSANMTAMAEKSTLQKVQDALIMYAKIRVLVKTFVQKRDQISQQVSFLGSHLLGLQTTEIDMVTFNGLESKYFTLKTSTLRYQNDTRAGKIRSGWSSISTEAINFDQNMRQIVNATVQIIQFAMVFDEVLGKLNSIVQSNARRLGLLDFLNDASVLMAVEKTSVVDTAKKTGLLDALADSDLVRAIEKSDTFQKIKNSSMVQSLTGGTNPLSIIKSIDDFMMSLVKLVSSQQQTSNSLTNLSSGLTAFKIRHNSLVALLGQIQKEYDALVSADLLKKKAWRAGVWAVGLLALLFKW